MNARLALFTLVAAVALSACGNKGPLVLPDRPEDTTTPATDAAPADATDTAPASEESPPATEPTESAPTEDTATPATPEPLPQDDND